MASDTNINRTINVARENGFSLVELSITVAVIGLVSAFSLYGINSARASMRLNNSVRQLAAYMEKARVDAVRRHASTSISFTSPTNYTVHMDFDNNGVPTDRAYSFDSGVQVASSALPTVTFNWRGRTVTAGSSCVTTFSVLHQSNPNDGVSVDVSGSGDVTVENQQPQLPNVTYVNNISSSYGINSYTGVSGTTTVDTTPCLDVSGEGIDGDAGTPECTMHYSSISLAVRKNGGTTATETLSMNTPTLIVATYPSNLTVSPKSQTVSTGSAFSIKSNNTLRGPFDVLFVSQCGASTTVRVNVTN